MENIFELRLSDKAEKLLPRIHSWAKLFYTCTIVTCFGNIINGYINFKLYINYQGIISSSQKVQGAIDLIMIFIYAVLVPIQSYYMYLFTKGSNKALQYHNSEEFSISFEWLLKHVMIASMLFFLNSIWVFAQCYFAYKMLR